MTKEEAIKLIEHISIAFVPTDQYGDYDDPEPYEQAIDMAIESLQKDKVIQCDSNLPTILSGDYISRADAVKVFIDWGMKEFGFYDLNRNERFINALSELPSAELPEGDLISRADAIEVVEFLPPYREYWKGTRKVLYTKKDIIKALKALPSTNVDWIPCSERLPEDSGDYLVCPSDGIIEDYSDCSDVMIMPYDADCEAFGWWTERYDPISLGFVDSDFNEFEVLAWMPLPKPYRKDDER